MVTVASPVIALVLATVGNGGRASVADAFETAGPPVLLGSHRRRRPGRGSPSSQPPSSLGSSVIDEIDSLYQTFPYASAFLTCGIKAGAADIVAQKKEAITTYHREDDFDAGDASGSILSTIVEEGPTTAATIDARRNFSFVLYGGLYQGVAQFVIFNRIFPVIFGEGTDVVTVASKVAFDNAFVSPLVCLPVAYLVKSVVFRFTLEEARERYVRDVREGLIFKYWCFWIPAQSLTFGVVPEHLRIAWVAAVSFFWLVVFSSISSNADDKESFAVGEE
mmetsp:Transcript_51663/g.109849  ORF Transcript_51663/g.109849 Transcript_51663/m.109849 type:complete len:278 (+) Transcript_51663:184-1017(+)